MQYPVLTPQQSAQQTVEVFGGYNHNLRIRDGEFYHMENMTSASYPVLSPRGRRGVYATPSSPQGMVAKDALCYIDGTYFVMGEYRVDMGLSTAEEDCPKSLVSMGAYVVILPDKKYINTADLTDFGEIEASVTTAQPVSFKLCRLDGSDYSAEYTGSAEPSQPSNMALWIDTSTTPHSLKQYSASLGMWTAIGTTYIKISSPGIGAPFQKYDGINLSGLKGSVLYDAGTGEAVTDADLSALDGTMAVWERGDNYLVVAGMLDVTRTLSNSVTVSRTMPQMDFVIESENRLWGCRYGVAANGEVVNEIYASKLGDFKNWNCFIGASTDSYAASVGTDGPFTGAVTHLSYPLFFKENYLHKVYGNYPANYQIQTTACRGVQQGSHQSLAIVGEVLYYQSRSGICAYDGSLPAGISDELGEIRYSAGVACAHGSRYYISMSDPEGVWHLFVYDTQKGMWHREDNTRAESFCSCRGELYYIDHRDRAIRTVFGSGTVEAAPVEWMVETGIMGASLPEHKYISRMTVRISLELGGRAYFSIQYDSGGEWEHLATVTGTSLRSFSVPVRPRRCDHFRLRISGVGDAKIFSVVKDISAGGI